MHHFWISTIVSVRVLHRQERAQVLDLFYRKDPQDATEITSFYTPLKQLICRLNNSSVSSETAYIALMHLTSVRHRLHKSHASPSLCMLWSFQPRAKYLLASSSKMLLPPHPGPLEFLVVLWGFPTVQRSKCPELSLIPKTQSSCACFSSPELECSHIAVINVDLKFDIFMFFINPKTQRLPY